MFVPPVRRRLRRDRAGRRVVYRRRLWGDPAEALARVGGVSDDTLAEDTDLTMAVIRGGWRVAYEERAAAWTEDLSTLRQFWR